MIRLGVPDKVSKQCGTALEFHLDVPIFEYPQLDIRYARGMYLCWNVGIEPTACYCPFSLFVDHSIIRSVVCMMHMAVSKNSGTPKMDGL